jgi:NAD(P)-dependent dehydrogenase (short-subunit alcohol dehydrogenase family)
MKKNVLITGATGNLGSAVAKKFNELGYNVLAIVSPGKHSGLIGERIETYATDLTNEKEVATMITSIIGQHKALDAALLLVGGFSAGGIKETDGERLRKMYSLNFETVYFTVRPIFLQMLQQPEGGRIILVGARPSLRPQDGKNVLAYSLSKSLLFKLAEFLNAEGASHNVVTSIVVPSTIDTAVNRLSMPTADFSKWVKPEEIASVMAFITENKILRDPVFKVYGES